MREPVVPRFEPEVVASAARKTWRGDDEKVATTSVSSLIVDGVAITSRYDKAHEFDCMAAMVRSIDKTMRSLVEGLWCDSKANACFIANLKSCSTSQARRIAEQLEEGCIRHQGGHNGIVVEGVNGGSLVVDPYWESDHP